MIKFLLAHKKIIAFVAGGLSSAVFAPYYCLWGAVIAFSILMFLLLRASTARQGFGIGYSFGFAHFAMGLSWVGNALLIDADKFGWLFPITLLAAGAFFGLFFAFPAFICCKAPRQEQKWLVFGAAAVVFEWLRSFILSGFPWNLLGYSLAFSDVLIQGASLGGTYLLSLIAFLNYTVFGLFLDRRNIKNFAAAMLFCFCSFSVLAGYGWSRLYFAKDGETDTKIQIVQPSIAQQMKWNKESLEENFRQYIEMTTALKYQKPDFVVWGETASPFMLDIDENHRRQAVESLDNEGYLVAGMISYHQCKDGFLPHNSLEVLDSKGNVLAYYHKSHLVPFGEYIPLREYLPDFVRPVANAIGQFGSGDGPKVIEIGGKPSFGGVICYEIIFPHQVINQKQRPAFLVNLTNDGWYGISAGPYQHWVAAKLRAVEEGLVVVRAANSGISGMISAYGIDKVVLGLNEKGSIVFKLYHSLPDATFYGKFGNGVILTFCLILLFLGFIKNKLV